MLNFPFGLFLSNIIDYRKNLTPTRKYFRKSTNDEFKGKKNSKVVGHRPNFFAIFLFIYKDFIKTVH